MRKLLAAFIILVIVITGVRSALPTIIRDQANKKLNQLPDYEGHVGRVHVALLRGAFGLDDFTLKSKKGDMGIHIDSMETAIAWHQLIRRALVCSVVIVDPHLTLAVSKPSKAPEKTAEKGKEAKENVEKKTGKPIQQVIAELIPFRVDKFVISDGVVSLKETEAHANKEEKEPEKAPLLTDLQMQVTNLTNSEKISKSLVSTAKVNSKIVKSGNIDMLLHLNPIAKEPTFDLALKIEKVPLPSLNEFLEWQTGLVFKQGIFSLYSDSVAKDGGFNGYIKPFIENLEVENPEGKKGIVQKAKKVVTNVAAKLFANKKTEEVATKVPFQGRFESPQTNVWEAVMALLRNAFVQALKPQLDPSIHIKNT